MPCRLEPGCELARLCDGCLADALSRGRDTARLLGIAWAEQLLLLNRELRAKEWRDVDLMKASAIAKRRVLSAMFDARVVEPLAPLLLEGAAQWWRQRPARYRAKVGRD